MSKIEYIKLIKSKLNTKEEILYSSFENYFTDKFNYFYSVGIDIALAKKDINQSSKKRKEELLLVGEQPLHIDEDFIKGFFGEIVDNLIKHLDEMIEKINNDPYKYLHEFKLALQLTFDETLPIFFKRILPQNATNKFKTAFLEKFERKDYHVFTSDFSLQNKIYSDQMKIHELLKTQKLYDSIRFYFENFEQVMDTCSKRIDTNDLDDYSINPNESFIEMFQSDIDIIEKTLDNFFIKLIELMKNGLPIKRKPFSTDIISMNKVNILLRNQILTDDSTKKFIEDTKIVFSNLKEKGLDKVLYGCNIIFDLLSPISEYVEERTLGLYFPIAEENIKGRENKFRLKREMSIANSVIISATRGDSDTLAHELGHRYYYLLFPKSKLELFKRSITTKDIPRYYLMTMYWFILDVLSTLDFSSYMVDENRILLNNTKFFNHCSNLFEKAKKETTEKAVKNNSNMNFKYGFSYFIKENGLYNPSLLSEIKKAVKSYRDAFLDTGLLDLDYSFKLGVFYEVAKSDPKNLSKVTIGKEAITPYADSLANKDIYLSEAFAELFCLYIRNGITVDILNVLMKAVLNPS